MHASFSTALVGEDHAAPAVRLMKQKMTVDKKHIHTYCHYLHQSVLGILQPALLGTGQVIPRFMSTLARTCMRLCCHAEYAGSSDGAGA